MSRTIDFAKYGVTGSERFKPRTPEAKVRRIIKGRQYGATYRKLHNERERARWRKVAAERRAAHREELREVNRKYYRDNRATILLQKREYYQRVK